MGYLYTACLGKEDRQLGIMVALTPPAWEKDWEIRGLRALPQHGVLQPLLQPESLRPAAHARASYV